jgi:hypothetical protein
MAKKRKKKLEEDAWLWMSQPSLPGIVSNPFFEYSFTAPETPAAEKPLLYSRTGPHGGAEWGKDFMQAWGYYAGGGLIDPKLPAEGIWWAGTLGVGRLAGTVFAAFFGIVVVGTVLTIVDPHHKYEGGLDESQLYQDTLGEFEKGWHLGWSQSPANPSNW